MAPQNLVVAIELSHQIAGRGPRVILRNKPTKLFVCNTYILRDTQPAAFRPPRSCARGKARALESQAYQVGAMDSISSRKAPGIALAGTASSVLAFCTSPRLSALRT